jgi:hypothetical protein
MIYKLNLNDFYMSYLTPKSRVIQKLIAIQLVTKFHIPRNHDHKSPKTFKMLRNSRPCQSFQFLNPWRYSSNEPWPAEQPPLAVFPDCTRRYWVDMWSAHRIPQLSKPDRYFFIQVTTQFIRSRG